MRKQFTTPLPVTQVSQSSVLCTHSLAVLSSHRLRKLLPLCDTWSCPQQDSMCVFKGTIGALRCTQSHEVTK